MRLSRCAPLLIASLLLVLGCSDDALTSAPEPKPKDVIVPVPIMAKVGSTFTYDYVYFDENGDQVQQYQITIELTDKNATLGGVSGVNVFGSSGYPLYQMVLDTSGAVWEYHEATESPFGNDEYWKLISPTLSREYMVMDTTMVQSNFTLRMIQKQQVIGAGTTPFNVQGTMYDAVKIEQKVIGMSSMNGQTQTTEGASFESIYIPEFAILAYERLKSPNGATQRLITLVDMNIIE
jgi:hypothetical protein